MEAVQKYMVKLAQNFNQNLSEGKTDFWDCVVISAGDNQQKECFQQQLNEKLVNGELPGATEYLVIDDCPGCALGSGGSTFYILKQLKDHFADKLYEKKILISHAGGSSKRLPNLSCIGKLFCPLPLEVQGKAISILNLKMIITSPFLKLMKNGGLFVCASDDIETYCLDGFDNLINEVNQLSENGILAIAHPSTLAIGYTHGVYVLPTSSQSNKNCWLSPCLEVLQKPSYSTMKEKGALFKFGSGDVGEERVYTDSMFWCGPGLVRKMVSFALENEELYKSETCIYGDFLACMGSRSSEEKIYWKNTTPSIKRDIASRFGETPLNIIVLEQSSFYHLGTMPEYLENLNPRSELFLTLGMKPRVQSLFSGTSDIKGVVTTSLLQVPVKMMEDSIMDSCIINVPIICERSTIVSSCCIDDPEVQSIPANWMFHTAALKEDANSSVLYVTVAFCINDDLKGSIEKSSGWKETHLESPLCSLWLARLFEAKETMGQSFTATWRLVTNLQTNTVTDKTDTQRFSMEDILKLKYIPAMMEHKRNISEKIKLSTQC